MESTDAPTTPGPSTDGWRFDNGYAEPVVPPPTVHTKGFPHVAMTPE